MSIPYAPFQKFVLRTPSKPLKSAFDLLSNNDFSFNDLLVDESFKEALFIASPDLIKSLNRYDNLDHSKKFRLELAVIKYQIRAASRCTPFGLFSGCSLGSFHTVSKELKLKEIVRRTTLDMNLLVDISELLFEIPEIKVETIVVPNTTIYPLGGNYRYLEHKNKGDYRKYSLENIKQSTYLQHLLEFSKRGKKIQELYTFMFELVRMESNTIKKNEIVHFIDELLRQQWLIPRVAPSLIGEDYFKKLIDHVNRIAPTHALNKRLKDIHISLNQIDQSKRTIMANYETIVDQIYKLPLKEKYPYYFQTDCFYHFEHNILHSKIPNDILKGLEILQALSSSTESDYLVQFKNAFVRKYESRAVPLSEVFDAEVGIQFRNDNMYNEFDFIDDFELEITQHIGFEKNDKAVIQFLYEKYEEVLHNNLNALTIHDSDLKTLKTNHQKTLSNTFSVLVEVYNNHTELQLYISSVGGSTALNLISRFSQQHPKIASFVNEIIERENEYERHKILAEINHIPENRTVNVLKSSVKRPYEIVFLSNSEAPYKNQILIQDIYVQVKNDRIRLWSKRLGKEIQPILSTAHNYETQGSLPLYRFLSTLQFQEKKRDISFSWPSTFLNFKFLPRVQYKNMLFSKARWKLTFHEIEQVKDFNYWRMARGIPQFVQILEHDNLLLINLEHIYSIELLKRHCKKHQKIWISEFLFSTENGLQINEEGYANEYVISYYKKTDEAA